MTFRIGHGYDVHAFTGGKGFTLGGVFIDHDQSLVAHSDGDVLAHAITDALLGALALGDIGQHFPDTDDSYKGMNSLEIIKQVIELIRAKGFDIINIDSTIQCQAPKLVSHIVPMRHALAEALAVSLDSVSIKATTTEKLGFVGKKQGIAVDAVVILQQVSVC